MEFLYWLCAIMLALFAQDEADRRRADRALFGEIEWQDRATDNESSKGES